MINIDYKDLGILLTENSMKDIEKFNDSDIESLGIIYGHQQTDNGKWYVGQTVYSKNPYIRWGTNGRKYMKLNENGEFSIPAFASAILKYGWDSFDHYILGFYNLDSLDSAEEEWISKKDSYNNGYNTSPNAIPRPPYREHLTDEHKLKIKQGSTVSRKVEMVDPDTKIVMKEFLSLTDASKFLGINHRKSILNAAKNNSLFFGYLWKVEEKPRAATTPKVSPRKGVPLKSYNKTECFKTRQREVNQYDLNMNFIKKFDSIREATKSIGLKSDSTIRAACNDTRHIKTAAGYKWSYSDSNI